MVLWISTCTKTDVTDAYLTGSNDIYRKYTEIWYKYNGFYLLAPKTKKSKNVVYRNAFIFLQY